MPADHNDARPVASTFSRFRAIREAMALKPHDVARPETSSLSSLHWPAPSTLFAVLTVMCCHANPRKGPLEGLAWPAGRTVADEAKVARSTAANCLRALEELGLLQRLNERHAPRTITYRLGLGWETSKEEHPPAPQLEIARAELREIVRAEVARIVRSELAGEPSAEDPPQLATPSTAPNSDRTGCFVAPASPPERSRDVPVVSTSGDVIATVRTAYEHELQRRHGTSTYARPREWEVPVAMALELASSAGVALGVAAAAMWRAWMADTAPFVVERCHPPHLLRHDPGPTERRARRLLARRDGPPPASGAAVPGANFAGAASALAAIAGAAASAAA